MAVNNRIGSQLPTSTYLRVNTEQTSAATSQTAAVTPATKATSVNLFDVSSYAKGVTVTDSSGQSISLPTLSDEEVAKVQSLFGDVPDDQKEALNAASGQLGQALMAQMLQSSPAQVSTGDDGEITGISSSATVSGASTQAKSFAVTSRAATTSTSSISTSQAQTANAATTVDNMRTPQASPAVATAAQNAASTYANSTTTADGSNAVMATVYMGVVGLQGQMGDYAATMNDTLSQKKAIDSDYQELKDAVANWPDGTDTQVLPKVTTASDGTVTVTQEAQTKAQAQASAEAAQTASQNYGSDNQMQMIQLQYMQSQYANAINGLSNIMKVGYDMAKNTIGNIHY